MPRLARIVIPGVAHHVVQRGNNRQDVFFVDDDYRVYLAELKRQAETHGVDILGWCLMANHVHLIARPGREDSLAKAVGRTHFRYAQYINRFHGRSGHLWQGRFHSCALDEEHFRLALRYVERNPVATGLVARAWEYDWSSAGAHVGEPDAWGLLDQARWEKEVGAEAWRKELRRRMRKDEISILRKTTERGWPLATDRRLAKLEKRMGRRLQPLPVGRPEGSKDKVPRHRGADGKKGKRRARKRVGAQH